MTRRREKSSEIKQESRAGVADAPRTGEEPKLIVKGWCFSYSCGFRSGNTVGFPAWDSSYFSDVQDVGPLFWADFTPDKERGILGAVED